MFTYWKSVQEAFRIWLEMRGLLLTVGTRTFGIRDIETRASVVSAWMDRDGIRLAIYGLAMMGQELSPMQNISREEYAVLHTIFRTPFMISTYEKYHNGQLTHAIIDSDRVMIVGLAPYAYVEDEIIYLGLHPLDIPRLDVGHTEMFAYKPSEWVSQGIDEIARKNTKELEYKGGCFESALVRSFSSMKSHETDIAEIAEGIYHYDHFRSVASLLLFNRDLTSGEVDQAIKGFLQKTDRAIINPAAKVVWLIK